MKAYVINLKSRPDRWASIKKRFSGSDIELERLEAVKSPSNGAHGCFLSFIKALKLAKKAGLPNVLILEDDCLPVVGWKGRWRKIQKWLDSRPEKWDLYSGGSHQIAFAKQIGQEEGIIYYDPVWSIAAHWLYIPERSYDMLLSHYEKYSYGAAVWSKLGIDVHNNLFKTVITHPFVAYQESGHSNINKTYRNTNKIFKNAEMGLGHQRTLKSKKLK
jgi:hypothetical protein